jgi:hypothetical protein
VSTRAIVTMIGFALGAWLSTSLVFKALERVDIPRPQITLDAVHTMRVQLAGPSQAPNASTKVVLVGDSLMMGAQLNSQTWVSGATANRLALARPAPVATKSLVYSGLSVYSHYYVVDEILAMKPNLVVIEFNLYYFSRFWQGRERVHLASLMRSTRWPALLRLQPERVGLTVDKLLWFRSLYTADWFDDWRWLQLETARAAKGYWVAAEALQAWSEATEGLQFRDRIRARRFGERNLPYRQRATPLYARELYGPALEGNVAGHAVLDVLSALLSALEEQGVATMVFVPPYNVEHLRTIGVWNDAGVLETIAEVRRVAESEGARFVDLHDTLPDTAFRDSMDHLTDTGPESGVKQLSERLSREILDVVSKHRSS